MKTLIKRLSQLSFFNRSRQSKKDVTIIELTKQVELLKVENVGLQTSIDLLVEDIDYMKQGHSFEEMLEFSAFGIHPCYSHDDIAEYIEAMQGRG